MVELHIKCDMKILIPDDLEVEDDEITECPVCGGDVELEEDNFHPNGESLWCRSCLWEENEFPD